VDVTEHSSHVVTSINAKLRLVLTVPALGHTPPRHQQALMDDNTFKWADYNGSETLHLTGARPAAG